MHGTTHLPVTPEVLWPHLTQPALLKGWMTGLQDIVPHQEGEPTVGDRFTLSIKEGRKINEYLEEILNWDPCSAFEMKISGGCFPTGGYVITRYELKQEDHGTRLSWTTTCHGSGCLMSLLSLAMVPMFKLQMRTFMKRLRRQVTHAA